MIKGTERLLESMGQPGWRLNEVTNEVELYNPDRTRRLIYHEWGDVAGRSFVTMDLYVFNQNRGWNDAFVLQYLGGDKGEEVSVIVMAQGKEGKAVTWDPHYTYSIYGRRRGDYTGHERISDRRIQEDRDELLPKEEEMPAEIDLVMTANLFIDQFSRGEMSRPVLVPVGLFEYLDPIDAADPMLTYGRNMDQATQLLAKARTEDEVKVAKAIYKWVENQRLVLEAGI